MNTVERTKAVAAICDYLVESLKDESLNEEKLGWSDLREGFEGYEIGKNLAKSVVEEMDRRHQVLNDEPPEVQ